MLLNELKKILNWRILLLVIMAAIVLFYSGPLSQLNLEHLPLFETVEAEVGAELKAMYGEEFDEPEVSQIETMKLALDASLENSIIKKYPQIRDYGFSSYAGLKEYWSSATPETEQDEEFKAIEELYLQIISDEEFEYQMEKSDYFANIITGFQWRNDGLAREEWRDTISTVPSSVMSNMTFVMENFSSTVLQLVILLILPYLAMDNWAGVYPLIASTRTGRGIILKQLGVMLGCVAVLLAICDAVIFAGIKLIAPYEPFMDCVPDEIWSQWTLGEYWTVQVLLINAAAFAMALLVFTVSSVCKTIVGTVVAALPCWALSTVLSLNVLNKSFSNPIMPMSPMETLLDKSANISVIIVGILLALGICSVAALCAARDKKDIDE